MMGRGGFVNYLKVNESLINNSVGESKAFKLPRVNPFPKLTSRAAHTPNGNARQSASRHVSRGAVMIKGDLGSLPEMETDVIDLSASYAVQNVKRERSRGSAWSRMGLMHLVGRMLGSHRAARP